MAQCLKCSNSAEFNFSALEVHTLHIRGYDGEKRVQALGKFQDYSVCRSCAEERLSNILSLGPKFFKSCATYTAVLALGIVLTGFFRYDSTLRVMGLAAVACGVLGLISNMRNYTKRKQEYSHLRENEAMTRAAWECVLDLAPKKNGDSDITYIPIDQKTLAMKNGDLMVIYNLLPQIADKAYGLIHNKNTKNN